MSEKTSVQFCNCIWWPYDVYNIPKQVFTGNNDINLNNITKSRRGYGYDIPYLKMTMYVRFDDLDDQKMEICVYDKIFKEFISITRIRANIMYRFRKFGKNIIETNKELIFLFISFFEEYFNYLHDITNLNENLNLFCSILHYFGQSLKEHASKKIICFIENSSYISKRLPEWWTPDGKLGAIKGYQHIVSEMKNHERLSR